MKIISNMLIGFLCILATVQPADAKRFRVFGFGGFGGGETIDLVYDLPDGEPFVKDGKNYDVGYLNGRYGNAYVLYHGDRYSKLDTQGIGLLTSVLGFDPTAKHRAQYAIDHAGEIAEAKAEQAHKDARIASGLMIERRPGEPSADYAARRAEFMKKNLGNPSRGNSNGSNFAAIDKPAAAPKPVTQSSPPSLAFPAVIVVIVLVFGVAARKILSGNSDPVASAPQSEEPAAAPSDYSAFDARVAQRLNELQIAPAGMVSRTEALSGMPAAPARGFGRKTTL